MKRTSSLIAFSTLLHLVIVDITFFLISAKATGIILALVLYNLIWLWMLFTIVSLTYSPKK